MTVVLLGTSSTHIGTGVSSIYTPNFSAIAANQVRVKVNGTVTTSYTLSGLGGPGSIGVTGNFTSGATVLIERITPLTQEQDIENNETVLEGAMELPLDRLTMIAQEQAAAFGRTLRVPVGETIGELPAVAARSGLFLAFDGVGQPIAATGGGGDSGLRTDLAASAGTGWSLISGLLGTVTRTLASILGLQLAATPEDFGAVGDGTTDDRVALQAWLDRGGDLRLPRKEYYSSGVLYVRKQVCVSGSGIAFDVRILGIDNMPGSRIRFANNSAGLLCYTQTTLTDTNTVVALGIAAWTQEGARGSIFRNFLLSGGGASGTGFESRAMVFLEDVWVYGFGGKAFDIQGSADITDLGSDYGNTSLSRLLNCKAWYNGSHGFHIRGRDSSVISLIGCDANSNGGWGFLDEGFVGSAYDACHATNNAAGSYKVTSIIAAVTFNNCYVEGGTGETCSIPSNCQIAGGTLPLAINSIVGNPASAEGFGIKSVNVFELIGGQVFPGAVTNKGRLYRGANLGLVIQGANGATSDITVIDKAGATIAAVPVGTQHVNFAAAIRTGSFTVSTVPSAGLVGAGATIYVSNEAGGAVPAFSDGANWLRHTDRAVIS